MISMQMGHQIMVQVMITHSTREGPAKRRGVGAEPRKKGLLFIFWMGKVVYNVFFLGCNLHEKSCVSLRPSQNALKCFSIMPAPCPDSRLRFFCESKVSC